MRILHIMAGKGLGGAETYATDIMLSLQACGVDQRAVVSAKAPRFAELSEAGVPLAPEVLAPPFRFWQRARLAKLIARDKPDLIHCWMRRAASLMPSGFKGPVIGWFGGYYDPKNFKCATHFVGVTPDIVAHQVARGVPADRAFFIPTFPDVKEEPAADRAAMGVPEGSTLLLALSRLHPKKGLDVLIESIKDKPNFYVWLAGEGPLRGELEAQVARLGLTSRVRFLGWRTDRGALLRAADICVLPSRYEPFGTVILEAWAAGTPLVACMSAGPLGAVRDGTDGILVPIDDAKALGEAFETIRGSQDLRYRLIAQGYAAYIERYTREAVTAQMIALYEKILASRRPF